ncbi:hypothetical protein [Oceanicoccus sagamiensis]|uniref:PEP-CTERM protein-sorting domain-containing protein n=1 Tax=Oceanicoccus sagamiensis TaxID=716816 RepID=A0A1X9NDL2_9GAMM|nr:hypothetical protein [Oceanicoccus sagamiensis]ARN74482.1 hypothetical protein BST96_10350 [Oceanicoccus sagamiensis]
MKKLIKHTLFLSLPLVLSFASSAFSAVILVSDDRSYEYAGSGGSGAYSPSTPFALWQRGYQGRSQTSVISTSGFSASGSADAYSDYDWSQSESIFDFTFQLTSHYRLTITGLVWGQEEQWGEGNASSKLYEGSQTTSSNALYSVSVSAGYGYEEAAVNYSDILGPGVYRFKTIANPYTMIASSGFSVSGNFVSVPAPPSAVPVPAAAWLFGSALLGLIGVRRSK